MNRHERTKANEYSQGRACQRPHTLSPMRRVTLHDIKDALFDRTSQLVDTGLIPGRRLPVTSCQFRAGPNDHSVLPYKP